MNQISHKIRAIACFALFVASTVAIGADHVAPFLNFRSPGTNTVPRIVGMNAHKFLYQMDGFYGTFAANFAYERSFRDGDIASALFGSFLTGDDTINIKGSAVTGRTASDLLADNFLLPRDFVGTLSVEPRVQNFVLFLEGYFSFDEWVTGLYLDIYGSVVNSRYDLNVEDAVTTAGTATYAAGVLTRTSVTTANLFARPLDFFTGKTVTITGLTVQSLQNAKMKTDSDKETAFSELYAQFGYNFLLSEDYHLGLNIQAGFPTGDKPEGQFLFEAFPSSGKSFKLGGGLTGHYTMWRSENGNHHFDIAMDATVLHWFNGKQRRTFDLKGKPLSRYMLAQKMKTISPAATATPNAGTLLVGTVGSAVAPNPAVQFADEYAPVANFSTRDIKVSVGAEVDAAIWFAYICKGFEFDLGYNLWYRSQEKIKFKDDQPAFPENTWALKGIAQAYASTSQTGGVFTGTTVALSGTDSAATIGANSTAVDSSGNAVTIVGTTQTQLITSAGVNATTSSTPILIKESDLDVDGAETRGISHKVFGHFSYSWLNMEDWVPYLGATFEAEFGHHHDRDDKDSSSSKDHHTIGLSKWAVSLKVGVSFD